MSEKPGLEPGFFSTSGAGGLDELRDLIEGRRLPRGLFT
jgi:hypothetical protein